MISNDMILQYMNVIILILFFCSILYPIKHLCLTTSLSHRPTKIAVMMVATRKTIGTCLSTKILKVLSDSVSTKTMICHSALPTRFQCIWDLPPLYFQTLCGKTTSTKAVQLSKITFPEFNSNISIDSQVAYSFNKIVDTI